MTRNKAVSIGAATVAAGVLLFGVLTLWRASRTVSEAALRVKQESRAAFDLNRLEPVLVAGMQALESPATYRDAALYRERLYVAGPSELARYSADGAVEHRWRVGQDLPAAPLLKLATGLAGASEPRLFIATEGEGLLIYDGKTFQQVRPKEPARRKISALLPLASGRLLLATAEAGVLAFDGDQLAPLHPSLASVKATALAGDEADLWIGTLDSGLVRFHAGEVARFGEADGLPDKQVLALAAAGESLFAGTAMGVAEFRQGRFYRTLAMGFFARSLLVRGETLVIGTLEEGVVSMPLLAGRARGPRPLGAELEGAVERLLEVDGEVWAITESGLYRNDERRGGWRKFASSEGAALADHNIAALNVDEASVLWVGYFDRGLDILAPGASRATHFEDEHLFCVNRIVPNTARGVTAVATANGLVLFDASGRPRQVLGRNEGLIANHVTDVAVRADGGWVVATPAGLTVIDGQGARSLYAFHGLVNNHVYSLGLSGNRVHAGTLGGLSVLDGDVVTASYTTANSALRHNWITAIAEGGNGADVWVGTYGAGVLRLGLNGAWQRFADLGTPVAINPNAMLVTRTVVYAGTLGQGLAVYPLERGRWSRFTAGLPSANVTALARDRDVLYIGTDNGLVRVPEQSILARP